LKPKFNKEKTQNDMVQAQRQRLLSRVRKIAQLKGESDEFARYMDLEELWDYVWKCE
jgi:hypothetical protein